MTTIYGGLSTGKEGQKKIEGRRKEIDSINSPQGRVVKLLLTLVFCGLAMEFFIRLAISSRPSSLESLQETRTGKQRDEKHSARTQNNRVVHVAPWGDDEQGSGEAESPLASPHGAQRYIRALRGLEMTSGSESRREDTTEESEEGAGFGSSQLEADWSTVTVKLEAGTYYLPLGEPLELVRAPTPPAHTPHASHASPTKYTSVIGALGPYILCSLAPTPLIPAPCTRLLHTYTHAGARGLVRALDRAQYQQ